MPEVRREARAVAEETGELAVPALRHRVGPARSCERAAQREHAMTNERFNELLNGPLSHPLAPFAITRLALALRDVVISTGEAGERALEEHCRARQDLDELKDWEG